MLIITISFSLHYHIYIYTYKFLAKYRNNNKTNVHYNLTDIYINPILIICFTGQFYVVRNINSDYFYLKNKPIPMLHTDLRVT